MYHRKSVSKLILLLSPIKCHFALQCFSSSVILKRISIGTATIATATATEHHQTAMIYSVCRWRWRKPFTAIVLGHVFMCVFVYVYIYFSQSDCVCISRTKVKKMKKKKMKTTTTTAKSQFHCSICVNGGEGWIWDWLVGWFVDAWMNEYIRMYTLLYLCIERIFGWCYCVCCWLIFFSAIKDQTIYQSELVSIYILIHIYLTNMVNAMPFFTIWFCSVRGTFIEI